MKILVADDDPQILYALRFSLEKRGYQIIAVKNGSEAITAAADHNPDLVLLDLGMPELDGLDVIAGLRGWSQVPILVVSGRNGADDKVEALDAGADDYITKPFALNELLARVRALARRNTGPTVEPLVTMNDITINFSARTVTKGAGDAATVIRLTPTEWHVLETLVRNPGRLVTRQTLLTEIWGASHVTDTGYLRLYIAQLRKKLEADPGNPRYLLTEAGMGYRFERG